VEAWTFLAFGAAVAVAVAVAVWWARKRRRGAAAAEWAGREFKEWRPLAAQEDPPSAGFAGKSTSRPGAQHAMLNYLLPDADDVADATIECAVAGIGNVGMCGEHRQDVIRRLAAGQELVLWRHTDDRHDENAVAVFTLDAKDIGHLPAETAERVAAVLDRNRAVAARVVSVDEFTSTGGERLLGARLALTFYKAKGARTE
jgi:hypothetical protein